jgi:hypothetical protein
MIRRLLEADVVARRDAPTQNDLRFWLLELRTPALLIEFAQLYPELSGRLLPKRSLLAMALSGNLEALERALLEEELAERQRDRSYWLPLKKEIEE